MHWYTGDNKANPTFNQNSEFFANYFGASMLGNQAMLDNQAQFFPTATERLNSITNDIVSRIGD